MTPADRKPPKRLAICSATVEILGSHWPQKSTIWAGLRLHQAKLWGDDLKVPWCHVNDYRAVGDCIYRLSVKDERYRFVKARNGAWILEMSLP